MLFLFAILPYYVNRYTVQCTRDNVNLLLFQQENNGFTIEN